MQWLDRALFVSPYHYGLCCTEKAFHKELRRLRVPRGRWPAFLGSETAGATIHVFERHDRKRCAIITLNINAKRTKIAIHASLVHEATHLWQYIRKHIGEDHPSDEFEAYAIQAISQRLMEAFEEYSEKHKKVQNKRKAAKNIDKN